MKLAIRLAVIAALGVLIWYLPYLEWALGVKWMLASVAFLVACILLEGAPLSIHFLAGWALVIATLYQVCYIVPIYEHVLRENYLIFYFHFPSAITCLVLFVLAGGIAVAQLVKGSPSLDYRASSAIEVGVLACTVTLVTGMIWADAAWGKPWVWHDPRLMTVAIMWFTYVAYLLFRLAVENPVQRARFSSVLAILFAVNVPLVWFAIRWFGKVSHPMNLEFEGDARFLMSRSKWFGALSFFVLYHAFWRLRYLASLAQGTVERLEERFSLEKI